MTIPLHLEIANIEPGVSSTKVLHGRGRCIVYICVLLTTKPYGCPEADDHNINAFRPGKKTKCTF